MAPPEDAASDWRRQRRERDRLARRRRRRRHAALSLAVVLVGGAAAAAAELHFSRNHTPRLTAASLPRGATTPTKAARTRPAAKVGTRARNVAVPILMYHVIAPPFPNSPFPGLYVPPTEFRAQMQALARAGFHAVTLDRVRAAWNGTAVLPVRPIVLTFDNGYRSQYLQALPVLRRLGWVADENLQLTGLPPRAGGLSTRQVRALVAAGWELDTQGYNHADLVALDAAQLHLQIAVTRRRLQRLYGVPVNWFCYPSGHYNPTVVAAVKAAGFVGSTTVVPGWARRGDDPYALPRLRVLGGTSPRALLALIAGAEGAPTPPSSYPAGA